MAHYPVIFFFFLFSPFSSFFLNFLFFFFTREFATPRSGIDRKRLASGDARPFRWVSNRANADACADKIRTFGRRPLVSYSRLRWKFFSRLPSALPTRRP